MRLKVMEHDGGHLPFQADVSSHVLLQKKNRMTVAVNNTLTPTTLPPGRIVVYDGSDHMHPKGYTVQQTWFDFCK
jgi:beta-glucuronidase